MPATLTTTSRLSCKMNGIAAGTSASCCTASAPPAGWPRPAVAMGGYVSFSGILTFPKSNELREHSARPSSGPAAGGDRRAVPRARCRCAASATNRPTSPIPPRVLAEVRGMTPEAAGRPHHGELPPPVPQGGLSAHARHPARNRRLGRRADDRRRGRHRRLGRLRSDRATQPAHPRQHRGGKRGRGAACWWIPRRICAPSFWPAASRGWTPSSTPTRMPTTSPASTTSAS